jgi:aryl-alcohol dehydrogenase-like predicted oxidoreductase
VEQRTVGHTDVRISLVGLGGYELGPEPDEQPDVDRAVEIISTGIEHGVNWLDTSENYLTSNNESLIGTTLEKLPTDFLVGSKVAPHAALSGGASGFRPEQVHAACRGSLQRLGRDHLDMYLLHYPDESGVPLEDTWAAMAELADAGLVRAIGLSNYELPDIERCHAQRPVDVLQTGLSMLDYLDDRDMIKRCGELGIAVTIYEPVANGLLTEVPFEQVRARWAGGIWEESAVFQRLLVNRNADSCRAVTDGLRDVARQIGATVAQTAIAWVLRQPGVTAAIAGSGSVAHTAENARAGTVDVGAVLPELERLVGLGPAFLPD